ncbi:MAG: uroporphyrinogen-III synthase [Geminicoccaceae bacterium]|nr:uroporphyrinogen-III synthase [Geminicoccaceae bacterium]MCS7268089.1 uroporphyrinogen-III synthase [Geminicoccaceae bacterium]MCX7629634.1 uroporphyrinogen-III synthase [Geminicoccaceae bacterium]MDW8125479.1 uroporphyrinogen-III synthase [Geminicoccaceae bacterium]MDW8342325.1 uroporphyrinogen-III synthase [Geminicoccaceae bacterium]
MRILLTRPRQQSLATARLLHSKGHRVLIDPMLTLRHVPHEPISGEGVAAVVLTSANALPGLDEPLRRLPVFAVGQATAQAALAAGCTDVVAGSGEGIELAELVRARIPPSAGIVLHVCGEEVRDGLQRALETAGYRYERLVVYRAEPATRLAPRTIEALQRRELDAVLFYSPRTARTFAELVEREGLVEQLRHTSAVCLSEAIAEEIRRLPWRSIEVAARRDQSALLACLDDLAAAMIAQHGVFPGRGPFARGR